MSIDPSSFMGGKDMPISKGNGRPKTPRPKVRPWPTAANPPALRPPRVIREGQPWRKPDPPRGKVEYEGGGPGFWMLAWAMAVVVIVTWALLKTMGMLD